jgi:hypothetical protein
MTIDKYTPTKGMFYEPDNERSKRLSRMMVGKPTDEQFSNDIESGRCLFIMQSTRKHNYQDRGEQPK